MQNLHLSRPCPQQPTNNQTPTKHQTTRNVKWFPSTHRDDGGLVGVVCVCVWLVGRWWHARSVWSMDIAHGRLTEYGEVNIKLVGWTEQRNTTKQSETPHRARSTVRRVAKVRTSNNNIQPTTTTKNNHDTQAQRHQSC